MSKFIGVVCAAAFMLATSPNIFGENTDANTAANTTTTTTTMRTKKQDKPFFFKSGMPLDDQDNMQDGKMKYHAAIQVDSSWDMDVTGGYTYWYAGQDNMDIAYIEPSATANGFVALQDFGYRSGFKVGLGYDTQCDNWSVNANYTWYDHTRSIAYDTTAAAGFNANDWFTGEAVAGVHTTAASTWQLKMNMIDLVAGRPVYEGKRVVVSPSAGVRVLFLHQNMNIDLAGGTAVTQSYGGESRSWAVGPNACLNTHWMLPGGFRIEGAMGSSVLYTRYTTITMSTTTAGAAAVGSEETKLGTIRPSMDAGLGLGYGAYAFNNKFFFDISARYDFMQFWSQNVLRSYSSQLNGDNGSIGDLRMHGLTVNLRCDF
jgi:hypothetical protein